MRPKYILSFFIIVIFFVSLIVSCKIYYKPKKIEYNAAADPEQLKEGTKLAVSICFPCHYNPETKKLTGKQISSIPKIAGKIFSRNITQHSEKGIKNYTDGELAYLLRTGISKSGKLMPYMQKPNLADEDVKAIIAFLRSDNEFVQPSEIEAPETKYTTFGKFGLKYFSGRLDYPAKIISKPDLGSDKINYGKYLVDNLSCYRCHSSNSAKVNVMEPEKTKGYMGGGSKLKTEKGNEIVTPNLTFDETGIKNWSEKDFRMAVKEGKSPGGTALEPPMPVFSELSDKEVSAIYAYLQTIPKIKGKEHVHEH